MKKTFKLMLLISSILFISKCWSIPDHHAYVSSHKGHDITSYIINESGDFIDSVTKTIGIDKSINGLAIAPDHRHIYFSYANKIGRCVINDDGSVGKSCSYNSATLPVGTIANFLDVDRYHYRIYLTDKASLNVYMCNIGPDNSLSDCRYALELEEGAYDIGQGVAISDDGKFGYIAYQKIDGQYTIKSCHIMSDGRFNSEQCINFNSPFFNIHIGGIAVNHGEYLLFAADRQQGRKFQIFSLRSGRNPQFPSIPSVSSASDVSYEERGTYFRTYDVAYINSNQEYAYITTSQGFILKFYQVGEMPHVAKMYYTQGRSSYAIVAF